MFILFPGFIIQSLVNIQSVHELIGGLVSARK